MILYLVPSSGISGDMLLGALISLGVDPDEVFRPILSGGPDFEWKVETVSRGALAAVKVTIIPRPAEHSSHRHLDDVLSLLQSTRLPQKVKEQAAHAFEILARTEAEVHGTSPSSVHFHEVGAVDSIVDIAGCLMAAHVLGITEVYSEPVATGTGWTESAHGRIPLPAPATVKLLEGLPFRPSGREGELVTPTGALLLKVLGAAPLPSRSFVFRKTGLGAGTRNPSDYPNVLRVHIIEPAGNDTARPELLQVIFDVDDMTGEEMGFLRERLEAAGFPESVFLPASYKKNRPGWQVHTLVPPEKLQDFARVAFTHSSTTGFRFWPVSREVLERVEKTLDTPSGSVRLKTSILPDGTSRSKVEYEDIAATARSLDIPFRVARKRLEQATDTAAKPSDR